MTLTTPGPWRNFILAPGVGRASLRAGRHRLRAPRWCAPFQREYGGDYRGRDRHSDLIEDATSQTTRPPCSRTAFTVAGASRRREYARIKIDGLRLVGGNPDFTNAPGHGDDDARFYDRQQAYVHARVG